jgi:predicted membrane chloride channel (bestrophin family)
MKVLLILFCLASVLFAVDSLSTPTPKIDGALTYTLTAIDTAQII